MMTRWLPAGLATVFLLGFGVFGDRMQPVLAVTELSTGTPVVEQYIRYRDPAGFSLELPIELEERQTTDGTRLFANDAGDLRCVVRSYPLDGSLESAMDALDFRYGDVTVRETDRLVKVGTGGPLDGMLAQLLSLDGRVVELVFSFDADRMDAGQIYFDHACTTLIPPPEK